MNICTNDGQSVFDACTYVSFFYMTVFTTLGVMLITSFVLGPAALLGCAVFLLILPIQVRYGMVWYGMVWYLTVWNFAFQ